MGVKSKLHRFVDETIDCCQIETRSVLCFQRVEHPHRERQRRLVCPKPKATILARRFNGFFAPCERVRSKLMQPFADIGNPNLWRCCEFAADKNAVAIDPA
jgi:hypothetical protein